MKSGFVAIIGQPNVGKSTLINKLIGEELAVVTPKPQTTRQNIVGILNLPDAQAVFLDTPGFHESKKALNKMMIDRIGDALSEAEVIILVVEPKKSIDSIDKELFKKCNAKTIIVINKIDTVLDEPYGKLVERYWNAFKETPTIAISAKNGQWVEDLLKKVMEFLPEGEPFYPRDEFTKHPMRFLAEEIIRGEAMQLLKQELPYSMAVEVEQFKEPENPLILSLSKDEPAHGSKGSPRTGVIRISASIIVEKDSQKGIVIGAKGAMIKRIGTLAREKIERLTGTKVFLELFVKVVKDWTKDERILKEMF